MIKHFCDKCNKEISILGANKLNKDGNYSYAIGNPMAGMLLNTSTDFGSEICKDCFKILAEQILREL